MNKEIKAKWVEALRSGKFKQAKGKLIKNGSYCCIGVLGCLVGIPDDVLKQRAHAVGGAILAPLDTIGLDTCEKFFLAAMNDGRDEFAGKAKTFKQIANYIEKNL